MMIGYATFAVRNWRALAFGGLLALLSSFGQTYYVSLFGAGFRGAFGLNNGGLGALYSMSTVLSALTLTWVGRHIDHTTVHRYTWFAAAVLAGGCLLTALAPHPIVLAIGFYFLRLGGLGLMMHTALTSTARRFPEDSGKALGVVMLGLDFAQAVLPVLAVMGIGLIGWRAVWVAGAAVVIGLVALATYLIPQDEDVRGVVPERRLEPVSSLWRDWRIYLALPAILAAPFIGTGLLFHQARLAQEKGWPLSWLAAWFVAYAVAQAVTDFAAGPIIDRWRPKRVLPIYLVPMAGSMIVLFLSNALWVVPVYLILMGISAAISGTLATALWVELYGPGMLARVRSVVEAARIFAAGAAPILMGYLTDWGVPFGHQALGCLAFIVAASLLALRIARIPSSTSVGGEMASAFGQKRT